MNISELKSELIRAAQEVVEQRISHIQQSLEAARETANSETKSSSGDKYETTRAMMHLEMEKLTVQLEEAQAALRALRSVPNVELNTISQGSIVKTSQGNFFLSISAGRCTIDNEDYFLISPAAPIARQMEGKKTGDEFSLNSRTYKIETIL
jgi:transcription elongation GreA/GreB family factor